jgi:hypothetical protein
MGISPARLVNRFSEKRGFGVILFLLLALRDLVLFFILPKSLLILVGSVLFCYANLPESVDNVHLNHHILSCFSCFVRKIQV